MIALAVVVILLALVPVAALRWATSSAGAEFLRAKIAAAAADAIEGRLELGRLELDGLLRVVVEDVRLYAPGDTEAVAGADRVVLDVRASALLSRRLEIAELLVEKPSLHLVQEGETTNLARAVKSKSPPEPAKPAQDGPPPKLSIHAPDIHVRDARLELVGDSPVLVDDLDVDLDVRGTPEELAIALATQVSARKPLVRTATLDLVAKVRPDDATIELLSLKTGASHVRLGGSARFDASSALVRLEDVLVAASDVNALAPGAKLLGDVKLAGSARLDGADASVVLNVGLPSGKVSIDAGAKVDLSGSAGLVTSYRARVDVDGVEPQRVVEGLPRALVQVHLEAEGTGLPPDSKATVELDASGSRFEALPIEKLVLAAKVAGLEATIDGLHVHAAGATVKASGTAGAERGNVKVSVDAPSLARTKAALRTGLGLDLPAMEGSVSVDAHVRGAWNDPRATATIEAARLTVEGNRVEGLRATVGLDSLPPRPQASFDVSLEHLVAAGMEGRGLSLKGGIDGQSVRVDAAGVLADTDVALKVRGERKAPPKAGVERWVVREIAGRVLGVSAFAKEPATIEVGNGRAKIDRLVLDGDLGLLTVSGAGGAEGPVSADVSVAGLRLERIPKAILPPDIGVAGVLGVTAKLTGSVDEPRLDAKVTLEGGRYRELRDLGLKLDALVADGRALADVNVSLPNDGRVTLVAKAPLASPEDELKAKHPGALEAALTLENVDVALAKHFAPELDVAGRVSGAVTVKGTWAAPVAHARVQLAGARGFGVADVGAVTELDFANEKLSLSAAVEHARDLGASVKVSVPLETRALLAGTVPDPLAIPFDAAVTLETLDLAWLAKLGFAPPDVAGRIAGRLSASGTAKAPVANGTFQARGLAAAGYEGLDAIVDVDARDAVRLGLQAKLQGANLANVDVRASVAPARLAELSTAQLFEVPIAIEAAVLPTRLTRLMPPPAPGEEKPAADGIVSATLRVTGTADAPQLRLSAKVADVSVSGRRVGALDVDAGYRGARTTASVIFKSEGAGDLVAEATLPGELGASVVMREGAKLLERSADVKIDAEKFDLAIANGFVPDVRDIAGTLDLHLRKSGRLLDPALQGTIAVRRAHAAVLEFGEFSDVALDAAVAWPNLEISRLSGKSGSGTFKLRADLGSEDGGRKFKGSFDADVKALPLVQNYQTRAYLSMNVHATATAEDRHIRIPELRISKGLLKIPQKLQKSVQSLDPHPDVVFAGEEVKKKATAAAAEAGWKISTKVVIPDDFQIEAPLGSEVVLGARLDVRIDDQLARDGGEPIDVVGEVRIVRGVVSFIRRFEVEKGVITFYPRNFTDPSLEVRAKYEGKGTTVLVDVGGTASHPTKAFTSKPAMLESEILYFLATGQRQTRAQSEAVSLEDRFTDAGLSLLGSAAAGFVRDVATLDVLSVETNVAQGSGRVRAGKFITERFYLGTQLNATADEKKNENRFEVEGEYRVNDDWYVKGRGGDTNRYDVEVLWEKNVPTSSQKGLGGGK